MYWILVIMATIAATLIALIVGGLATPRHYQVARTTTVTRSASEVHALLANAAHYDSWVQAPLTLVADTTHTDGLIAWRVTDDDTGIVRQWIWQVADLAAASPQSRITLTEVGETGNPIVRFFGAFVGHRHGADRTLRHFAESLGEHEIAIDPGPSTDHAIARP